MINISFKKGMGLVEVVIGAGLVMLIFSGLASVFNFYIKGSVSLTDNIKAEFLAEEGLEIARTLRDGDFSLLTSIPRESSHFYGWNGTSWGISSTTEIIDNKYYRQFVVSDVHRDASGNISDSGSVDIDMIKITTSVSWFENGATSTRTISTYLGNVFQL